MNDDRFKKHIIIIPEADNPMQVLGCILEFLDKNECYDSADRFVCMNGFCMGIGLATHILEGNFDNPEAVCNFLKLIPDIYYRMMESINKEESEGSGDSESGSNDDFASIIGLN